MENKIIRRIIIMATVLFLTAGQLRAQIFIADDEFEGELRQPRTEGFTFILGPQGDDYDAFVPLSDGLCVLAGLGGAYLLKKKKQKQKH